MLNNCGEIAAYLEYAFFPFLGNSNLFTTILHFFNHSEMCLWFDFYNELYRICKEKNTLWISQIRQVEFSTWYKKLVGYSANNVLLMSISLKLYYNLKYKNDIYQNMFYNVGQTQCKINPDEVPIDLYALACGPDLSVDSYSVCIVNGKRFDTKKCEQRRHTQNFSLLVTSVTSNQTTLTSMVFLMMLRSCIA